MNPRTLVVFVLALAVAAAAGFGLGSRREAAEVPPAAGAVDATSDESTTPEGDATVVAESGTAANATSARRPTPTRTASTSPPPVVVPVPLPPRDLPIAALYDELAQRARAGDARASCRLAVDLQRCSRLTSLRQQARWSESLATRDEANRPPWAGSEDQRIEQAARVAETLDKAETLCQGLPAARGNEAFDWLLRAAELGHEPSMVRFAAMPAVPFDQFLQQLDRLAVYRDRAPALAEAALRSGNVHALRILADGYRAGPSRGGFLGQVLKDDPVRAQAYATLAAELRGLVPEDDGRGMRRGYGRRRGYDPPVELTAEQQDAADALLRDLRDTTFAAARHDLASGKTLEAFDPFDPNDSASCESDD